MANPRTNPKVRLGTGPLIWSLTSPLPEELEKYRTALMPLVIKKTGKETGILFARIGQLGQELDKQRRRAQQLASRIDELKRGKHGPEYQACRDQPPDPGA